jgi:hypothetical protein
MYPVPREFSNGAELVREARAVRHRLQSLPAWVKPQPPAPPQPPPRPALKVRPLAMACCARDYPDPAPLHSTISRLMRANQAERIKKMVALHFDLTRAEIEGAGHTRRYAHARHIAFFLCVRYAGLSFPHIGRLFGDRDHTTVLHGVRKMTDNIPRDAQLAATVAEFVRQIEEWSVDPRAETGG